MSENGKAVWTVTVSPDKLSKMQDSGLWHIYPEKPVAFKDVVLDKIRAFSE